MATAACAGVTVLPASFLALILPGVCVGQVNQSVVCSVGVQEPETNWKENPESVRRRSRLAVSH